MAYLRVKTPYCWSMAAHAELMPLCRSMPRLSIKDSKFCYAGNMSVFVSPFSGAPEAARSARNLSIKRDSPRLETIPKWWIRVMIKVLPSASHCSPEGSAINYSFDTQKSTCNALRGSLASLFSVTAGVKGFYRLIIKRRRMRLPKQKSLSAKQENNG